MVRFVCIVEGYGEVASIPLLLRRIVVAVGAEDVEVPRPIRVARHKLVKPGELERAVELAGRQSRPGDTVLVLLDADDDCPATFAPRLLERARATRPDRNVHVVLANREFEAWFLAAAASLSGCRGLDASRGAASAPESVRDAKGWLAERMPDGSYGPTVDQPAFTARFDLSEARRRSPSFDKFWRSVLDGLGMAGE